MMIHVFTTHGDRKCIQYTSHRDARKAEWAKKRLNGDEDKKHMEINIEKWAEENGFHVDFMNRLLTKK